MNANKIPRSCGTHDGTFHADEVTACALLLLFNLIDQDKIFRTRDPKILNNCEYVCDLGGIYDSKEKLFDHHQVDYQGPLSSAGMILRYLETTGHLKINEYDFFNDSLVRGIDDHDNGKDPLIPGYCTFSHVISNFTPIQYDCTPEEQNLAFHEALKFTHDYLVRLWKHFKYTQSCREIVATCMEKSNECLIFKQNIPWLETFFELKGIDHPALFVIMPSGHHWKLRGIPPNYQDRMKVRLPQPKEWAGLLDDDLKRVSGIPGAIFCHKGRFISVWETYEDALKALEFTLKNAKEPYDNDFRENYQGRATGRKGI
ncbi:MAG: MYG1 family protein [Parachlamydiaceae bacterium]|nr:MYG1 family protein [Parachlamydiaceae bacterium]